MGEYINLLTGNVVRTPPERDQFEERLTVEYKKLHGACELACRYDMTFGWVPECGCPIHDPD